MPVERYRKSLAELCSRVMEQSPQKQILKWREDFDRRRGRMPESDDLWELWSSHFIEWCACENDAIDPADTDQARWRASHRSLFEVVSISGCDMTVFDLVGEGTFDVRELEDVFGVSRGDVVELRLVAADGHAVASGDCLYHPRDVAGLIRTTLDSRTGRDVGTSRVADLAARALARGRLQPRALVRAYEIVFRDVLAP